MSNDFFFYYTEATIVCVLILGFLLVHDLIKGDRQEKKFRFDNVLLAHILYFLCDEFWAAILAGVVRKTQFTVLLANYVLLFTLALLASTWFVFTAAMTEMPNRGSRRGRILINLPMMIVDVIVLIGMFVKPSLWINEALDTTKLFDVIFVAIPMLYIFCAFLHSVFVAVKKMNRLNRKQYMFLGIYPLTVVIAGLAQMSLDHRPIFCYSCVIMIIIFNTITTDNQISIDPLTGLNNRGRLMSFVAQHSSIHKEDMHSYVLIMDVNDFKNINDTYGHVEGDNALVAIADALRRTAGSMENQPFMARFGGDEFIMIAFFPKGDSEDAVRELIMSIRNNIESVCLQKKIRYAITVGIGYNEIKENDSYSDALLRADDMLYEDKLKLKASIR